MIMAWYSMLSFLLNVSTQRKEGEMITAVIPVRAGSRRVPNKNIKPFGDNNLLVRKIHQLKTVSEIDEIVISSDSDEMLEIAKNEGCLIQKRPIEYCDKKTKTFNKVVKYIASKIFADIMIWAPCVCPFTIADNFKSAIKSYRQNVKNGPFDSVVSAKLFKEFLFDEKGPCNFSIERFVKSQDLPDWKIIVNGFFVAKPSDMEKWGFVYGKNPYLVSLSKIEAIDIDDQFDFDLAEFFLKTKRYEAIT